MLFFVIFFELVDLVFDLVLSFVFEFRDSSADLSSLFMLKESEQISLNGNCSLIFYHDYCLLAFKDQQ